MATGKPLVTRHHPGGLFGAILQVSLAEWRLIEVEIWENGAWIEVRSEPARSS